MMTKKTMIAGVILSTVFILMTGCGKRETEVVEALPENEEEQIAAESTEDEETMETEADPSDESEEEIKDLSGYEYILTSNGENLFGFNIPEDYAVEMQGGSSAASMHSFKLYGRDSGSVNLRISTECKLTEEGELINQRSEKVQAEKQEEMETDLGTAEFYFTITTVEDSYTIGDNGTSEVVEEMYEDKEEMALLNIDGVTVTFWWSTEDDDYNNTVEEYTGQLRELLPLLLKEESDEEHSVDNWEGIEDNYVEAGEEWDHVVYARENDSFVAVIGTNDVEGWEYMENSASVVMGVNYVFEATFFNHNSLKGFTIDTDQVANTDRYNFYFGKGVSSLERSMTLQETEKTGEIDSPFGKILVYKSTVISSDGMTNERRFGMIRNNDTNIWISCSNFEDDVLDVLPFFFE